MESNIAILNSNGIHNLAHANRSRLHLEDYSVVAINNFSNFKVDRIVIYYRPGADLEPAVRLAGRIDVKVVLGHDLGPQQQAEAPQGYGPRL
jgi:hypothetical protein